MNKENKKRKFTFFPYIKSKNEELDLNFTLYNPKKDGLIFIGTMFIIPFFISLVFRFVFGLDGTSNSELYSFNIILNVISNVIGLVILYVSNRKRSKDIIFLLIFVLLPIIVSIFSAIIIIFMNNQYNKSLNNTISMISQAIFEIVIIMLYFSVKENRMRFIKPITSEWWKIILVTIVGVIAMFLISAFICGYLIEEKLFNAKDSSNQDTLESVLFINDKINIVGLISFIIFTIFIAPLCEEICARQAVFVLGGNRNISLIYSALYFGFIHYGSTCDFEYLLSYTVAGFILAFAFNFSNGKIIYSWPIHIIYNSIVAGMVLYNGVR